MHVGEAYVARTVALSSTTHKKLNPSEIWALNPFKHSYETGILDNILITESWGIMKQRTHRSCAQILNHKVCQKINVWCYKLLNSEQYIMEHKKKKLIQSPNILLRVRMYSGSSTTKKNSINNVFSIVTQLSTNRSKVATLSLCHLSFIFNGNQTNV